MFVLSYTYMYVFAQKIIYMAPLKNQVSEWTVPVNNWRNTVQPNG